ncbi:MAG TPA: hypothetical protein VI522_05675, partial [Gammaproteobacteria bacterium]|nr:hypothetical protein [Gammaproteobacteria bacterium]
MGFDYEKSNQLAASQQVYQDNNPTNLYDSRQRSRTTLLANRSDNFGGGGVSTAMYEHEANAQLRGMTPRQLDSPRTPRSKDPILPVKNTKIPNSYFAQFQGNLLGKQEDMQFAERFPTDPSIPEAGQTRDQFFRDWLKISLMRLNNEADPQISTHSGATAIICVRFGDTLYVESLGQCRAYLLNKDGIKQVSVTHQSIAGVNPGEAKRYFTQERYTRSLGNESWTANHPHRITGLSHESESTKYALLGNETLVLATDGAAEPLTSTEIHQSCYLANQTLTPDQQTFCLMKAVVTRLPKDDATVQVSELTQEEAIDVYAIFDGSGPLGQEFARNASEALSGVLAEVKASLIQRNALQNKCVALAADEQKKDRASQVLALLAKIDMTKTKSAMKFMADLEKMLGDENELLNFYTAYGLHAISNLNVAKNMLIQDLNRAA